MKQLTQRDLDELARYVDDELSLEDRAAFEHRLDSDALLQQRLTSLLDVHQLMKHDTLQAPSRNFTQRVMDSLDHYSPSLSFPIRNGVLLLAGVLIAGVLALYLASGGAFDGPVTISNPFDTSVAEKFISHPIPSFSFEGTTLVNAIVLLNLALGWVVLDRTILRPWFRRRSL